MRFEGFSKIDGQDGLRVGNMTHLRFAFDLQKPDQTYYPPPYSSSFKPNNTGTVTPKIITDFDLGGYCGAGADPSLFPLSSLTLPPGDPAWVDHIDLILTSDAPTPSDGSAPELPKFNGMCYGYRLNGVWHWELASQHAAWDPTTSTYQLRLIIQQGPIDAIKVLSSNGQANRYLDRMVLTTKPQ